MRLVEMKKRIMMEVMNKKKVQRILIVMQIQKIQIVLMRMQLEMNKELQVKHNSTNLE